MPNGETTASSPPRTSGRLLSLIDYEYAGYNPRGFDIGNHFCEWTADYAADESHVVDLERYPSMEERRRYCRAYLGTINGVRFCLPACLPACLAFVRTRSQGLRQSLGQSRNVLCVPELRWCLAVQSAVARQPQTYWTHDKNKNKHDKEVVKYTDITIGFCVRWYGL